MLHSITWTQFMGWMEYYGVEPFGEQRADLRSGIVASTIANVNRVKGKAFSATDFMPDFGKDREPKGKRKPLTDPAEFKRFAGMVSHTYRQEPTAGGKRHVHLPPGAVSPEVD